MSKPYAALLRGINVGKGKRIAMADLRSLLEDLGFTAVKTLLNSGNVVFNAQTEAPDRLALRIEAAVLARVGFSSRVTVLSAADLQAILDENPLAEIADDASRYLIAVLRSAEDLMRAQGLMAKDWSPERMIAGTRVIYLWCARGILESGMLDLIGKVFGERATTRNWATLGKLNALMTARG